jgi:prophage regulatory protein
MPAGDALASLGREGDTMRMLSDEDLKQKGIKFSRQHRHRLIKAGEFPRPVKLGANTNAWPEPEIDRYLEQKIAERDGTFSTRKQG